MPIAIASSSDSNFSSDFSSDSSEDSLRSSDSDAIYTDDEGSDSDDDFGQEDGSDPLKLATEGFRLVHMRKFGKLVHNTIPCAQCREQRRADLEAVIRGTKRPTKTNLREAADALFNTPTMQIVGEKHNGLASAITFACPECACERTFKTSPSFVPYKFSGVLNDVPLKAADADDGIVYDGDSEDSGASGGGNGSDDDDSDAEDNDAGGGVNGSDDDGGGDGGWAKRRSRRGRAMPLRSPQCHRKYSARIGAANLIWQHRRQRWPSTRMTARGRGDPMRKRGCP